MEVDGDPPAPDQVELVLIGPGYGESIVIHVGSGLWVIVDSCIDSSTQTPAALSYLESIGVSPDAVQLIIATHWHDDHIRGMARLLDECSSADFCISSALGSQEFLAMVGAYQLINSSACSSGVREIYDVISILEDRIPINAAPDRPIFRLPAAHAAHGYDCTITTLSPADRQISKFHAEIAGLMPVEMRTQKRCTPQHPNHLSVVTLVEIGPASILLGADLEETNDPNTGWSVIVNSITRPQCRAFVFKVPHHGSRNAHNSEVWEQMLANSPFAVLTPHRRSYLPTSDDVQRITGLTPNAFSTAQARLPNSLRRPPAVMKTLKEMGVSVKPAEPRTGVLRLRNGGPGAVEDWTVELFRDACHLDLLN